MPLKIFLIAGEASGDILGAGLMKAVAAKAPGGVVFEGVGGPLMKTAGLSSLFPMEELSVMGVAEVLPKLFHLMRRIRETADRIIQSAPDVVVTIDSPDFCFRVVKALRRKGFKGACVHYVAPSVWAWRPGRAKKIARLYDHLLALLPFEPPYFEKEGLGCTFVGHPVVGSIVKREVSSAGPKKLVLLPGSRMSEVSRLLPVFRETVEHVRQKYPDLQVVLPTLPHLNKFIKRFLNSTNTPPRRRPGAGEQEERIAGQAHDGEYEVIAGEYEKIQAFRTADVALAASGTVALELAAAGTPSVISYRLSPVSAFLARYLIKIPYVSLVNILLKRPAVPELLLDKCRADLLAPEIIRLLENPGAAAQQRKDFSEALAMLNPGMPPAEKAAQAVLSVIRTRKNA